MRRNERGIIFDWLLKIGIWLALISIVLFDAGAILVNHISLDSTANDMSIEMTTFIGTGQASTQKGLEDQAKIVATDRGVKLISVSIDEGGVLHITIRRKASTLIVSRISAIKDWAVATADGQSNVN